jgi:transcriptional regulator with XRE-family HTH domain
VVRVGYYWSGSDHSLLGKGVKAMEFGEILRKARLAKGYTQEEMAEKMNMSREAISKLERNRVALKAADFIRWFQVTDMPQIAAAMVCGADITSLTQLLNNLPTLLQAIGAAFALPILSIF